MASRCQVWQAVQPSSQHPSSPSSSLKLDARASPTHLPAGPRDAPSRYRSFTFAQSTPSDDAPTATDLSQIAQGKIKISLFNTLSLPTTQSASVVSTTLGDEPKGVKLPEGKKFFLAPSLATSAGSMITGPRWSTSFYHKVAGLVLQAAWQRDA
jgi:hypothetical protein